MKLVFFVTLASVIFISSCDNEGENLKIILKSKEFMDGIFRQITMELTRLKNEGNTFTGDQLRSLVRTKAIAEFNKRVQEAAELYKLLKKQQRARKMKHFKIHEQGSPNVKRALEEAASQLVKNSEISSKIQ